MTSFNKLALSCAPGVDLATLRGVAALESHFEPLAVRDNTTHESFKPQTLPAAAALARDRLKLRHSIDIGLMQINSANLGRLDISVDEALDECKSLAAASRILRSAFSAVTSEPERQAALLIALSRYNTGRPLAGIATGYANEVIAAMGKFPSDEPAWRDSHFSSAEWDIWNTSGAESRSWVITANESSEIKRAGAQSSVARNEVRAPAPSSAKGEPYEVFAYQESETIQP